MHACPIYAPVFPVTGMYVWLVCHILYGFLYTYVGYVLKLYLYCLHTYNYIVYCIYICMLVCSHSHRKCALLSTTSTASTCGRMLVYATSICPHPSADHKVPLPTCKVPLPRVHVRRKIIRGKSLQLQQLAFLVCHTHPLQHAISNCYVMAMWTYCAYLLVEPVQ